MADKLTLTIVIPAYNEQEHLRGCLDAIALQSEVPTEVIVVDNNSTDKTAEIVKNYAFVRLLKEKRQGIAYAHHRGFAAAKGQLIARIDADSVLPRDWVERVLGFYSRQSGNLPALVGSGYFKNLRARSLHPLLFDPLFVGAGLLLGHTPLWGPNMVIPKRSWAEIADETCAETKDMYDDLDIALHLNSNGTRIVWLRSLRVGARVKHLESPRRFWAYVQRWSGTLRNHDDWRWTVGYAGCGLAFLLQYPLMRLLRK